MKRYWVIGLILGIGIAAIVFFGLRPATHMSEPLSSSPIATSSSPKTPAPSAPMEVKKEEVRSTIDMKVVPTDSATFNGKLVALANAARSVPLHESAVLDARASIRARALCQVAFNESAHDSFYTSSSTSILSDLAAGSAENLARNFATAEETHDAFVASPTHRKNILNPIYAYMGVGHVTCSQNAFGNESITVEFFTSSPS